MTFGFTAVVRLGTFMADWFSGVGDGLGFGVGVGVGVFVGWGVDSLVEELDVL